jgi:uncharacterized membrane protein
MTAVDHVCMKRVPSLDIVRGAAMLLMAIDHVRVYAGVPAAMTFGPMFLALPLLENARGRVARWRSRWCARRTARSG